MSTITRSLVLEVDVKGGTAMLAFDTDKACQKIEHQGNKVVSVSHATHKKGFDNKRVWTVLILYTRDD